MWDQWVRYHIVLVHGLCNTTWWFCGTCYYISNHKGSCCRVRRQKEKRQDLSRTRLDRLAKGAFVKVGSMAWDVWIHTCSHSLLNGIYGFEIFHSCIAMVFFLNNTWWWMLLEVGFFFPQWGFPRVYLVSHFCGYQDGALCVIWSTMVDVLEGIVPLFIYVATNWPYTMYTTNGRLLR